MEQAAVKVKKFYWHLLFILAILVALTWIAYFSLRPDWLLKVYFFDVGQGDAIFIKTFAGNQILIDGGPDGTVLQKLGASMPFYDRTLDLVILTHPHADHVAGLVEVLSRYKVKNVMLTEAEHSSATYQAFLDQVQKKKIRKIIARAGQKVYLDEGTVMRNLYPFESFAGKTFGNPNEASIVSRLTFGKIDFLFTGDATELIEYFLLGSQAFLASEVLKIGHHGSKGSSSQLFLQAVKPQYAVISAGKNNRYGHPHQEVLDLLQKFQVKYLRTDQQGDVRMESDGTRLLVDRN